MKTFYSLITVLGFAMFVFGQQYYTGFETLTKSSYAAGSVDLDGITWQMDGAVMGNQSNDWFAGSKSVRMAGDVNLANQSSVQVSKLEMTHDKPNGIGLIQFQYRASTFSGDAKSQLQWKVEVSDDGTNWQAIGLFTPTSTVQTFEKDLGNSTAKRMRIIADTPTTGKGNSKRMNIDDLYISDAGQPVVLSISESGQLKPVFVKNTLIHESLYFGIKSDIQIINTLGQVVKTATVNEDSPLNIVHLQKGVYFVVGKFNGRKITQKIMKE